MRRFVVGVGLAALVLSVWSSHAQPPSEHASTPGVEGADARAPQDEPSASLDDDPPAERPWFTNVAHELGIAAYVAHRVKLVDVNGDGWPDILVIGDGRQWREAFLAAGGVTEWPLPVLADGETRGIERATFRGDLAAFDRFDTDGDGVLTQAEVNAAAERHRVRLLVSVPHEDGRRFVDTTAISGLWTDHEGVPRGRPSQLMLAADINDNGRLDLYSAVYVDGENPGASRTDTGERDGWYLNDGTGRFTLFVQEVPDASSVREDSAPGRASMGPSAFPSTICAATVLDVNDDGKLDLFTGSWYRAYGHSFDAYPDRLYLGLGDGRLHDVTEAAGLMLDDSPFDVLPEAIRETVAADWNAVPTEWRERIGRHSNRPTYGVGHVDWNNNGRQDLFALAYGRQWNLHWRNDGVVQPLRGTGGIPRFTDVGAQTGFDGDDDRSGVYPDWLKELWQERFGQERRDELPFRANGNSFSVSFGDYANTGCVDALIGEITHGWAGASSDVTSVLINRGPEHDFAFRRQPELLPRTHESERSWNQGDMNVTWIDVNNNGYLDALVSSSDYPDNQRLRLFLQDPETNTFRDVTEEAGLDWPAATQVSVGDINRNGALDIVVGNTHTRLPTEMREAMPLAMAVWRNDIAPRSGNAFVSLALEGRGWRDSGANRGAIGARVRVTAGGRTILRDVSGGAGHMGGQHDSRLVIGLGRVEHVERLEIRWGGPVQTVDVYENVPVNSFLRIREGGAAPVLDEPGPTVLPAQRSQAAVATGSAGG